MYISTHLWGNSLSELAGSKTATSTEVTATSLGNSLSELAGSKTSVAEGVSSSGG